MGVQTGWMDRSTDRMDGCTVMVDGWRGGQTDGENRLMDKRITEVGETSKITVPTPCSVVVVAPPVQPGHKCLQRWARWRQCSMQKTEGL